MTSTIPRPSVETLAEKFFVTTTMAIAIHEDRSGSTYNRNVFGAEVHYDTATRTLTIEEASA
jgi:hypothetical protein